MKIFLTGATGFIGKHVAELLSEKRHDLMLLVKPDEVAGCACGDRARSVVADIGDVGAFSMQVRSFAPDACIHLAWQGIPDYSAGTSCRNLEVSCRLIDLLCDIPTCRKIIVSGSCFEYGRKRGGCKETDSISVESFFAWAKNSLREYATLKCTAAGIAMLWLRFFYVYGPGQRSNALIPTIVDAARRGVASPVRTPNNSNDFVYVTDVAEGVRLAAEKTVDSGIYNIGSGASSQVARVCEIVASSLSGTGAPGVDAAKDGAGDVNFWADMDKTSRAFSWKPGTSLEAGVAEYIGSLREP